MLKGYIRRSLMSRLKVLAATEAGKFVHRFVSEVTFLIKCPLKYKQIMWKEVVVNLFRNLKNVFTFRTG